MTDQQKSFLEYLRNVAKYHDTRAQHMVKTDPAGSYMHEAEASHYEEFAAWYEEQAMKGAVQ